MKTIILLIGLILFQNVKGQKEDFKFAAYNTISAGFISGIGACLNKKNNTSYFNTFKKGFLKGCVGGTIISASKQSLQYDKYWISRIGNSIGSSIVDNAIHNRKIFSEINIQFYLGYIQLKNRKFDYSIDVITTVSALSMSFVNEFDLNSTLKTGSFIFINNKNKDLGKSFGNCLFYANKNIIYESYTPSNDYMIHNYYTKSLKCEIIKHEIMHTFQYSNFNFYSISKNKHINLNLNFALAYLISGKYKNNIYEIEANRYFNKI